MLKNLKGTSLEQMWKVIGAILVALIAILSAHWLLNLLTNGTLVTTLAFPVVVVIVVLMIVTAVVTIMTIVARILGVGDDNQPLGLPEGSVRSMITLILVAAYLAFVFFLATGPPSRDSVSVIEGLTDAERAKFITTLHPSTIEAVTLGDTKNGRYKITYRTSDAGQRETNGQILAALGTAVASILAFYFGSRITSSSAGTTMTSVDGGTRLLSATPATLSIATTPDQAVTVSGVGLERANGMILISNTGAQIIAANVMSDQTRVSGKFSLTGVSPGTYQLKVTTSDRKVFDLPAAFGITP